LTSVWGVCLHVDREAYDEGPGLLGDFRFVPAVRLYYVMGDERADHDPAFSNRIRDGLPGMAIPS
jgi:hypothetical protein